ncbi:MAG: nucleoside-triphosphatase [Acidobacteriota bacterium]
MIYIFSGPIESGKTTKLEKWIKDRIDVSGILMPVLDGIRHIYSINSEKFFPVEADKNEDPEKIINIGKYYFLKKLFDRGNEEIERATKSEKKIVIIDEIGPLELRGEGFSPGLKKVKDKFEGKEKILLLVIREGLVKEVTNHFHISEYVLISSLSELNIFLNNRG